MAFKINESIIVIQAEATSPNRTDVVFWSHDRGTAKLRMKLVRKNGIPQSLPEGTTVPIRLMFRSATAEGGYGKHDYLTTIEDRVNGIVSIVLEDNILGYVGIVEGSVYIDFPNDRSLDTAGRFTFSIKRSQIDDSTPELEDYYFNGFSQTIDKIEKILADGKQEIEQKITESETQIDAKLKDTNDKITKANQDVATLNTNIDKANDRIDQTNQQISDLGKLKKMYSNSIDFGGYDYSGNPNLMRVIKASEFRKQGDSDVLISDVGHNSIRLTSQTVNHLWTYTETDMPSLVSGKTYTISAKVKIEEGTTGNIDQITVSYRKSNGGTILLAAISDGAVVGKEIIIKGTSTVNYEIAELSRFYLDIEVAGVINGSVIVSDIKIEEGSTATPYQPNLLDDPYCLGKASLGQNIANKSVAFPIKSSAYSLYQADMKEEFIIGQTYTITMKATKPSTQTFIIYNEGGEDYRYGNLTPVEGLVDIWGLTFTPQKVGVNYPKRLTVIQYPQSTTGACQIDWLKIEKGNTRTPNISQFKYFGEGLKDSNNPNDYSWDITPEYTEKGLNNTVSLTEPETVLGLKNFKDGVQIDGVDVATVKNLGSVLQSGSGLTTIQSDKQSAFDEFSYEFERIGDRVFFHARVKTNSTTAVASHVNLLEIPLGFQFPVEWTIVGIPLSVVQWTTPQGEISALVITDLTGKQVVKFATNRVG
ncbi:BppU family phage baseplate upper protein, partial [Enterococcus faecium]|uniref:BppU family phage baseplate upper protein n=2 Tax=Enterococcus faecium TaxID=1352 RepID=UPI00190EFA67